jgi:hypothetical protein
MFSCERVSYVMDRNTLGDCREHSFLGGHVAVLNAGALLRA